MCVPQDLFVLQVGLGAAEWLAFAAVAALHAVALARRALPAGAGARAA